MQSLRRSSMAWDGNRSQRHGVSISTSAMPLTCSVNARPVFISRCSERQITRGTYAGDRSAQESEYASGIDFDMRFGHLGTPGGQAGGAAVGDPPGSESGIGASDRGRKTRLQGGY